jgi:hypothetical protein
MSQCISGKVIYVYGGYTRGGYSLELFYLKMMTSMWGRFKLSGDAVPPSLTDSTLVAVTKTKILLCRGSDGDYERRNECHLINCGKSTSEVIVQLPGLSKGRGGDGLEDHTSVRMGNRVLIVGGWTSLGELSNSIVSMDIRR